MAENTDPTPRKSLRSGAILALMLLLAGAFWAFAEVLDQGRQDAANETTGGPIAVEGRQELNQVDRAAGAETRAQGDNILHEEDTVGELIAGTDDGETQHLSGDEVRPDSRATGTLAQALASPDSHVGKPVAGTAVVARVDSDRGFWVRDGQGETYVVQDLPEGAIRVLTGQEVRLTGTMLAASSAGEVPELEGADAEELLGQGPGFVRATEIEVLDEAAER